jgi:hypothetical protein
MLLGGLTAGALSACSAAAATRITTESYLTNEDHIPGAGYYHAPFRTFYPKPYNHYDAGTKMYYYGGQWQPTPHRSIVNISTPTAEAVRLAESTRTDNTSYRRSGFGSTSSSSSIRS